MSARLNSDSSISERIAQRDARAEQAMERRRQPRTEQECADAACEELDAKIEVEEGVARWARWLSSEPPADSHAHTIK
jgi:hypothetical protein